MLLNKQATRDFILKAWKEQRPGHEITQVSASSLVYFERKLVALIEANIHSHPSLGKTFKVG
jgi:hypothetical protein